MRLLVVTQTVDAADSNLGFFVEWLREFSSHYDQVDVIAASIGTFKLPDNVRVFSLGKDLGTSKVRRVLNYWKLLRRLLPECDWVFAHMCPEYVLAGFPLFLRFGKRIALWYAHKSVTWRLRLAVMVASRVFSASVESFRLSTPKLRVVGHGIAFDGPAREPQASGPVRFLTVGRVSAVKGIEVALAALEIFETRRPAELAWRYDVVGEPLTAADQEYLRALKSRWASSAIAGQVNFLGGRAHDELPEIYRTHDLFLHASATGSLDKAMLEALGYGEIVVSSSDAAAFLPSEMRFRSGDAQGLAQVLDYWIRLPDRGLSVAQDWSTKVRAEYGLAGLISRLVAEMKP